MKNLISRFTLTLITSLAICIICVAVGLYTCVTIGVPQGLVVIAVFPPVASFISLFLAVINFINNIKALKLQHVLSAIVWQAATFSIFFVPKDMIDVKLTGVWLAVIDIVSIAFIGYMVKVEKSLKQIVV